MPQFYLSTFPFCQSSLGTMDLGQVHYEPLKDRQGNVLLVTLKAFPNPPRLDTAFRYTLLIPH